MWKAREAGLIRQRLAGRGPWFLAALLGVVMATDTVSFALRLHRLTAAEHSLSPLPPFTLPKAGVKGPQFIIVAAHLFGRADALPDSAVVAQDALKLMGIIATDQIHDGYAIISTANGVSHLYHVGGPVGAGVTLSEVFPDHVVVLRDETRQTLRLAYFNGASGAHRGPQAQPDEMVADASASDASAPPPLFKPPPLPTSGAVLRTLHLRPATDLGEHAGMRVMGTVAADKPLAALGLNAGDVIVNVNGGPDGEASIAGDLMNTINAGETATLAVQRQGRLIEITIDPAVADAAADLYRNAEPQ